MSPGAGESQREQHVALAARELAELAALLGDHLLHATDLAQLGLVKEQDDHEERDEHDDHDGQGDEEPLGERQRLARLLLDELAPDEGGR